MSLGKHRQTTVYFNHSDYFTHHCKTCAIVIGWLKATYLLTYLLVNLGFSQRIRLN